MESTLELDPSRVPAPVRHLLTMAAKWGVGDDYERASLVERASEAERIELLRCIDEGSEKALFDWLEGGESSSRTPTAEYVALTNLTLAIAYARALGKKRT